MIKRIVQMRHRWSKFCGRGPRLVVDGVMRSVKEAVFQRAVSVEVAGIAVP